jgi:nucleoside 2-deoxyribosyltransferase
MPDTDNCYFCDECAEMKRLPTRSAAFYECKNCGRYIITDDAKGRIAREYADKKHIFAGYLMNTKKQREANHNTLDNKYENHIDITEKKLERILSDPIIPRTIVQRLENILLYLYNTSEYVGYAFKIEDETNISALHAIGYSRNLAEFTAMCKEGEAFGWWSGAFETGGTITNGNIEKFIHPITITLTAKGMTHAEQLISTNKESKKAFIAMGFVPELILAKDNAIIPACKECGFDADTVSQTHLGDITDRIIAEIKTSRFVVCDFTYNNHGAYYEAGFARGLGLPVICCCNREWFEETDNNGVRINKLHFDVEHLNMLLWSTHDEYREKLIDKIRANIL